MITREELEKQADSRLCVIFYLVDLLGGEVVIPREEYDSMWGKYEYQTENTESSVIIRSRKIYTTETPEEKVEETSVYYLENDEDFDE
jgi:hypothetical protein